MDRRRHRGWFERRLDDEAQRPEDAQDVLAKHPIIDLGPGRVHLRDGFSIERALLHIADDTDDPHPSAVLHGVSPRDTMPHRVVVVPETPGQYLIDQYDRLGAVVVLRRKETAALQRDTERVKVLADQPFVRDRVRDLARRLALVLDRERAAFANTERQIRRGACRRDPRNPGETLHQSGVERADIGARWIRGNGQARRKRQRAVAVEPGIDGHQSRKARNSKPPPTSSTTATATCSATRAPNIRRCRRPGELVRPPSLRASAAAGRETSRAGSKPQSNAVSSDSAALNARMRPSIVMSPSRGIDGGAIDTSTR